MKTYIVSGAGSGIGRAIAQSISKQSSENRVILAGRKMERLEETRALLPNPEQHIPISLDVTKPNQIRECFLEIKLDSLNLSGVIANAGLGGPNIYGDNDAWHSILDVNLTGSYNLVNESLHALKNSDTEYKQIILVSSILARIGVPAYSAYCAAKAGLLGLMRSWAIEFAAQKILVNAICPGWVDTAMAREGIEGIAQATGKSIEVTLKEQLSFVPLQKMSKPEEVASLASYLLSDNQNSITGQALDINGGAFTA